MFYRGPVAHKTGPGIHLGRVTGCYSNPCHISWPIIAGLGEREEQGAIGGVYQQQAAIGSRMDALR